VPTTQVNPIHFEDFSGVAFERLAFAFHLRTGRWRSIEWYGQVGSDLGRDILAIRDDDTSSGEAWCIQCANHRSLPPSKATRDIDKARASPTVPYHMRFVCGGSVSAKTRDKIRKHAAQVHLPVEVWSGTEFEERLRHQAEPLLQRFVEGVAFPDSRDELLAFVQGLGVSEDEAVRLLAALLDRPAFYTPFRHESSVPAFRHALDDTIRALATGVRQTREGAPLPKVPSRHELHGAEARRAFAEIETGVARLRARLEDLIESNDVRPCENTCGSPDCSVYFLSDVAIRDMDEMRSGILDAVRGIVPGFTVRVGW
jgi:hypothetical protein